MDDKELEHDVKEGQKADKFLKDPIFAGAVITIKATLMQSFEDTEYKDSEKREEVWRKLQALRFIEQALQNVINTGKFSEQTLLEKVRGKLKI